MDTFYRTIRFLCFRVQTLIQQDSPGSGEESNWLPAPKGQFKMVLRGYQPKAEIIDGRFRIPAVERVD